MKKLKIAVQKFLNKIPKKCNHEKFTCVTEGNIAFVKCYICGSESLPWRVRPETGKAFREANPDSIKKAVEADNNAKIYWEQFK